MNEDQFFRLMIAILTVVVTIGLVIGLKIFGNLNTESIGSELNILTYGFLWDTILQAIYGNYWKNYPKNIENFKGLTLCIVVICNIILMAINFKIVARLKKRKFAHQKKKLKYLSYFLGIVSLIIFLTFKVFFE